LAQFHIFSYDFELNEGTRVVDRGTIDSTAAFDTLLDIAWDSDDILWALETNSIRQLLPGNADKNAVLLPKAIVTDNVGGQHVLLLFPDEVGITEDPHIPGISYNQHTNKLYVSANDHLFELEKVNDFTWNITQAAFMGDNAGIGDLAFDPFGKCFCVYNNSLANVEFMNSATFGALSYVNQTNDHIVTAGLDFVLDIDGAGLVALYEIDSGANLYKVDYFIGSRDLVQSLTSDSVTAPSTVYGASSCQAGEDLREPVFPFHPGNSPWFFMLDTSTSMNSNGTGTISRMETLKNSLIEFMRKVVTVGQKMTIVQFGSSVKFQTFIFNGTTDIENAVSYVESIVADDSTTIFCGPNGPFNNEFFGQFSDYNSCVVIGDGNFAAADCPAGPAVVDCENLDDSPLGDFFQGVMDFARGRFGDQFRTTTVAIQTDGSGLTDLQLLGCIGGGGFTEWI